VLCCNIRFLDKADDALPSIVSASPNTESRASGIVHERPGRRDERWLTDFLAGNFPKPVWVVPFEYNSSLVLEAAAINLDGHAKLGP
jgi:hypothetical protein